MSGAPRPPTFVRRTIKRAGKTIFTTVFPVQEAGDFGKQVGHELDIYRQHNPGDEPLWNSSIDFDVTVP